MDFDVVKATGLTKVFGATRALINVDVEFRSGTVTSIEGPNGAGKSTLVNVLSLITRPSRGEVFYGTHSSTSDAMEIRARIGLLSHSAMLYPDLTGRENLRLFGELYEVPDLETRIAHVASRFETEGFMDRPLRTYSRGQSQRLALSRALLHAPRLLLLDEPTTGLDEASVARLVDVVEEEKERGAIVVLVTHDHDLAKRIANERVHLLRGRIHVDEARP